MEIFMKKLLSPAALVIYAAAFITFIIFKIRRKKENYA